MQLLGARAARSCRHSDRGTHPTTPPQAGHGTARVDLLAGQRNGRATLQINARPPITTYWIPKKGSSAAPPFSFSGSGQQIRKRQPAAGAPHTSRHRFTPAPYDGLMSARSWRVRFGLTRSWARLKSHTPTSASWAQRSTGPRPAAELNTSHSVMGYVFLDNQLWLDPSMPKEKFAAGSGIAAGLLWDATRSWRIQVELYGRASGGAAKGVGCTI